MTTNIPVGPDTPITIKIALEGSNRKFKVALGDLGPAVLPGKLRQLLSIPDDEDVVFERFSDSAAAYVTLDTSNPQVYKTLFRAAKAKLKLRLRASFPSNEYRPIPSFLQNSQGPSAAPVAASSSRPNRFPQLPVAHPLALSSESTLNSHCSGVRIPMPNLNLNGGEGINLGGVGDAPVPKDFTDRQSFFAELANISRAQELALRMKEAPVSTHACSWSVYCNACDKPMANEHYHCSICDDGDYDLCEPCVNAGMHCPGEQHWLVKRFVNEGKVINSTTERVRPKATEFEKGMPGAFTEEKKIERSEADHATRTCNSCVKVFAEAEFVTCVTCEDYDLCMPCHIDSKHGHHPGHTFKAATTDTQVGPLAQFLCAPGRNVRHSAICDGCDKFIYGVRHKCLNCPDWDYCSECIKSARSNHPMHRFVPIYDPLPEPRSTIVRHYGIYCDGPLCSGKESQSYIEGVRYKCAICSDHDFCANCEASPRNKHNRTHPLIKFKTPVRNVSVTTMGEDKHGEAMKTMGDAFKRRSTGTETVPAAPAMNAATQVQTIVDLKPSEESTLPKPTKEKIMIKDLLAEPIQEKIKIEDLLSSPIPEATRPVEHAGFKEMAKSTSTSELTAHFVRDTIADGSKMVPNQRFLQVWTLRNPGPQAWPSGCSVRYVGGDSMLNIDQNHPSSAAEIAAATESNVYLRPVGVNEEIAFGVMMKAPRREGTSISYWRLKAADGTPFGHRLWCHIDVNSALASPMPQPAQSTIPSPPMPLEYQAHVNMLEKLHELNVKRFQRLQLAHGEMEPLLPNGVNGASQLQKAQMSANTAAALAAAKRTQMLQELGHEFRDVHAEASSQVDLAAETQTKQVEAAPVPEVRDLKSKGRMMIFPQLDKESPVASTHEACASSALASASASASASVSAALEGDKNETKAEGVASPESTGREDSEFFEDAESVDVFSSDDGFMTDEEYDILDASDEEELA